MPRTIMCPGLTCLPSLALAVSAVLFSQTAASPSKGRVERIKVHGSSLEGNLAGDSADRDVSVYLPPSYQTDRSRRYPVVYMLHGFTDSDLRWMGFTQHWIDLPAVIDRALASAGSREMILVMPNAYTRFQGSMYSSSVTTGDWESYIARELVGYIDAQYRTIPETASRGLAGHSMGGYGTLRIGMKHADVFGSIYALSPCCLVPIPPARLQPINMTRAQTVNSFEELDKADFGTKAALASAAAWSPNPRNPPLYIDLPWKAGQFQPPMAARWAANSPLAMLDQYVPNLKRLRAIAFDAGDKDAGIADSIRILDKVLDGYKIAHEFEIYPGTHTSHVADRIESRMLPFFSRHLVFNDRRSPTH